MIATFIVTPSFVAFLCQYCVGESITFSSHSLLSPGRKKISAVEILHPLFVTRPCVITPLDCEVPDALYHTRDISNHNTTTII